MKIRTHFPVLNVLFASLVAGLMCGCSGSFAPSPVEPNEVPIGNIQGTVHGGQQPVTGAQIYLFAASTAGFGSASTSLITSGKPGVTCNNGGTLNGDCFVTTDSNGNFALGGEYTCTQGTQVYMVAVGGNPGLSTSAAVPFSTTATFGNKKGTMKVANATGITTGMAVTSNNGLATGTTVSGVAGTTITLSQNTTSAQTNVTVTFSTTTATVTSGSTTITVASATGVATGFLVGGNGVGGTVTKVTGTTITLSQKATVTGTNVPVTFTNPATPVNNSAIVQMAALAQCPAAGNLAAQVPFLVINEVTTVAMAYSMSGFGSDAFHIAADATGATALANAMANANNIVNIQYGQAPTVANGNSNSISPQAKLYSLANIVALCVNSTTASSPGCTSLFNLALNADTTAPTDESTALFNIAQNQGRNVLAIYNLTSGTPVFSPTLSKAPTDWTMPVVYTGLVSVPGTTNNAITSGPFNIAFDANGNAWIGDRVKGVVEIEPQGASTTINKGFGMVKGVTVSPIDGTIWVSDFGNNVLDVMNSSGTILTSITTDMNGPIFTAFSGNTPGQSFVYAVNETTTGVVLFDPQAFTVQDFENANFSSIQTPGWISVDNNGNAWIPSTSTNFVGQVTVQEKGKSGNFTFGSSQIAGPQSAYSMAADANGNLWFGTNTGTGDLEEIPSEKTAATDIGTGGGLNGAFKIAVDGNNTLWIANANANTVTGYNGGFLTTNGFSTSAPGGTGCVVAAPDPSGNLWTANADGSVTQLLGLATPTAAPFFGGVGSTGKNVAGNLGTEP